MNVQKIIRKMPFSVKKYLCQVFGHPLHAIQIFTWIISGEAVPGHVCGICCGRVIIDHLCKPDKYIKIGGEILKRPVMAEERRDV